MKAIYITPSIEVIKTEACALMAQVSGAGLNDGGQDTGTYIPQ